MTLRDRDQTDDDGDERSRVVFRSVAVFDRSQVDPLDGVHPTPLEAPSEPLTGDTHAHLLEPAAAFTTSLGYTVVFESTRLAPAAGATGPHGASSSTPTRPRTRNCGS